MLVLNLEYIFKNVKSILYPRVSSLPKATWEGGKLVVRYSVANLLAEVLRMALGESFLFGYLVSW